MLMDWFNKFIAGTGHVYTTPMGIRSFFKLINSKLGKENYLETLKCPALQKILDFLHSQVAFHTEKNISSGSETKFLAQRRFAPEG